MVCVLDKIRFAGRLLKHPFYFARPLSGYLRRLFLTHAPVPHLMGEVGSNGVVVSLTTFGKRLDTVYLAVLSMMHQTVKPDLIVLWLDRGMTSSDIPLSLHRLVPYGLDIRYDCEDLKGHKKYYWALKEFKDCCVITIDDDVIYPHDTLESLLAAHKKYPDAVVARRVNKMTFDGDLLLPYEEWEFQWAQNGCPRRDLLATGVGGVLYPPNCFSEAAFDCAAIAESSLSNDDIWLKAQELLCGRGVAWAPCNRNYIHPYEIDGTQDVALYSSNGAMGGNDIAIHAIERELGVSFSQLARGNDGN